MREATDTAPEEVSAAPAGGDPARRRDGLDLVLDLGARALPLTAGILLAALGRTAGVEWVSLPGIVLVAGSAGDALLPRRAHPRLTLLERAVLAFILGLAALGGVGLLLADLGLWRPWAIVLVALALGGAAIARDLRAASRGAPRAEPAADDEAAPPRGWRYEDAGLVAIAVVIVALAWPPFEWVIGGRDPGLYVNTAYRIAKTGSIRIHDPDFKVMPPDTRWENGHPGRLMGAYFTKPDMVTPHGFHLLPATMAAGGIATGSRDGRGTLPLIAIGGLLAAALVARRLAPRRAPPVIAAITLGVLGSALVVYWYLRYPATEPLSLACLMGGSLLLATALPGRRGGEPVLALVAGLLLGMQLVVRPDAVALAPAMAVAVAWWLASGRPVRASLLALGGVAATMGAGLLHARLISDQYSSDVYGRFDVARMAVAICVAAVVAFGLAALGRRRLPALLDGGPRALGIVGGALGVLVVGGLVVGSVAGGWIGGTWLTWYLTPLLLLVAVPGAGVAGAVGLRRDALGWQAPLLVAGTATALVYLRDPEIFDDQPWAARRFLPVIIPTAVALFAVAVGSATIALRGRGRALAAVAVVVPLLVAVGFVVRLERDLEPALDDVDYEGASAVIAELDRRLGPEDTLVLMGPQEVAGNRFATALDMRTDRIIVPFREDLDGAEVTKVLEREVGRRPVMIVNFGPAVPALPPGLVARRVGVIPVSLPEMERPVGKLPRTVAELRGAFNLYRIAREEPA